MSINIGAGQVPSQMKSDWENYFNSAKPGESIPWGGGTLTMGSDGQAVYASPYAMNGGTKLNRLSIDNPNTLQSLMAQSPAIAKQWGDQYGLVTGLNQNDQAYWDANLPIQPPPPQTPPAAANPPQQQQGPLSQLVPSQMNADFANYWATTNPGDSQRFGAGTLFRTADGSALYTNSAGVGSVINSTDSIQGIASSNPEIAQAWRDQYGYGGTPSATLPQQPTYQQPNYQQPNYQQPNYPQPTAPQNEYQMPVLNALYQGQQQRMAAPAPQFNFQAKGPLTATSGAPQSQGVAPGEPAPGALTTVINGG